jgi:hypothetical protein
VAREEAEEHTGWGLASPGMPSLGVEAPGSQELQVAVRAEVVADPGAPRTRNRLRREWWKGRWRGLRRFCPGIWPDGRHRFGDAR